MTILAGLPIITEFSGNLPRTTLPAPTIQLSPIVVFGRIVQLSPINTLLPIFTFPKTSASGRSSRKHQIAPSWVIISDPPAIAT